MPSSILGASYRKNIVIDNNKTVFVHAPFVSEVQEIFDEQNLKIFERIMNNRKTGNKKNMQIYNANDRSN